MPEGLEAFRALARAGEDLFRLHADYEELELWPLEVEEAPGAPEDPYQHFRIEQPRLDAAKRVIRYNDWITIRGLPEAAFTWRPGGYGPLEWIVRYWRVATKVEGPPKRRIIWDPNHVLRDTQNSRYLLELVGKAVRASVKTQEILASMDACIDRLKSADITDLPLLVTTRQT